MCHFFGRILLFCTQWYLLFGLPESKNEIGLWIAHPPCFVISANDLYGVENIVKNAIRYSNSGEFANEDSAKLVLREFRLKSWNVLYKTYKIISFSLTSE